MTNIYISAILFTIAILGLLVLPEYIWKKAKYGSGVGLFFAYIFLPKDFLSVTVQDPGQIGEVISKLSPTNQAISYVCIGYILLITAISLYGFALVSIKFVKETIKEEKST